MIPKLFFLLYFFHFSFLHSNNLGKFDTPWHPYLHKGWRGMSQNPRARNWNRGSASYLILFDPDHTLVVLSTFQLPCTPEKSSANMHEVI